MNVTFTQDGVKIGVLDGPYLEDESQSGFVYWLVS